VGIPLKFWQFTTPVLAALTMGMTFSHFLQMHSKMEMSGPLWLTLQHSLYTAYRTIGGPIEVGAMLFAATLAYLVRADCRSFQLTSGATILLAVAFFAVWIGFTYPVNARTLTWSEGSLPPDWSRWRAQWEYSHAVRFVLQFVAFCLLVSSTLVQRAGGMEPLFRQQGRSDRTSDLSGPAASKMQAGVSVTVSQTIHAPRSIVQNLYSDYSHWSTLFPATIRGVSFVRQEGDRTVLDVDHVEGHVSNILRTLSPNTIELEESKRKYDAIFWNTFEEIPDGTRMTVVARVRLKGFYRVATPFICGVVRGRIKCYVLDPLKTTAERRGPG
jgi:hypothetical protein